MELIWDSMPRLLKGGWLTIELTAISEHRQHERRHPLGGGIHGGDGVLLPGASLLGVRVPTPQVHEDLVAAMHGEARAHLAMLGEVPLERFPHGLEA